MKDEIELVLNATSYGIEASKAKQLEKVFVPMVEKFKELEEQYNEVLSNKEITKDVCAAAKIVRNKYVKVRTGTDAVHKVAKEKLLIETRAVDGLRNIVKFAAIDHENSLLEVEKHFEKLEAEKLEATREERTLILARYDVNPGVGDLVMMSDEVWGHYIKSVETDFKAKKEAEIKAEKERIAKQKAEIEEQKRIKAENEKLKKEAELKRIADEKAEKERERLAKIESDKRAKIEKDRLAKQEEERKAHEVILQKERDEKLKIQKELEAKQEEERKAKDAETLRLKNEADLNRKLELAPDKEKLEKWISNMKIGIDTRNMNQESEYIVFDIYKKFDSFKNWAVSEIKKIK